MKAETLLLIIGGVFLVGVLLLFISSIPEIKRYLKMKSM